MKGGRCRCGAVLVHDVDRWICPECRAERHECECQSLSRQFDPDDEGLEEFEHCIRNYESTASDVIDLARELRLPEGYLRYALRDADWSDDSIDEIAVEATGHDPRLDDEVRREDPRVAPIWSTASDRAVGPIGTALSRVEKKTKTKGKTKMTARNATARKTKATQPKKEENVGDVVNMDQVQTERPIPQAGQVQWIGIPIGNPTAKIIVEKVANDMASGKINPDTPEGRQELREWTDLILRQEQIYGQVGFALRSFVLNKETFSLLKARILGRAVESGTRASAGGSGMSVNF